MRTTSTPMCDAKDCGRPALAKIHHRDQYLCLTHLESYRDEITAEGGFPNTHVEILRLCCGCGKGQYDNKLDVNGRCYDCAMTEHTPPSPYRFHDAVNHPQHYTHPSGVECITVTEHMNFCLGNAIKYLWRADRKNGLEDLKKARWYIDREIERREK